MALEADKDTTYFFQMSFRFVALSQVFFPLSVSELTSNVKVGNDQPKQCLRLQPSRVM